MHSSVVPFDPPEQVSIKSCFRSQQARQVAFDGHISRKENLVKLPPSGVVWFFFVVAVIFAATWS